MEKKGGTITRDCSYIPTPAPHAVWDYTLERWEQSDFLYCPYLKAKVLIDLIYQLPQIAFGTGSVMKRKVLHTLYTCNWEGHVSYHF